MPARIDTVSLASWVAKIGVNPTFIAANAHCWFAFAVIVTAHRPVLALPALAAAAVKEFYFDAHYEVPKQTFTDNATDFAGYALGIALAVFKLRFLP
jgi:hypothetical protein